MAWTTPKTWTAALVTVADLNTHLRDNLDWLKTRPIDSMLGDGTGDYQVTSTSATKLSTDFDLTIDTTASCKVLVLFSAMAINSTTGQAQLDVYLDGSPISPSGAAAVRIQNTRDMVAIAALVDVASAGSHTFSIYVWSASGQITVDNDGIVVPSFVVVEIA